MRPVIVSWCLPSNRRRTQPQGWVRTAIRILTAVRQEQMPKPPRQSPIDKLGARIEAGNAIAEFLEETTDKAHVADRHELRALATRLRFCNHPANSFLVKNATANASTETFDAIGRLWRCGSKLCPDCLARQSRLNRKKVRVALSAQRMRRGDRYYFTTFTIPNEGLPLVLARSIVNRAWTLFRKRKLCASLIRGGLKTEEFTVTSKGYHYHLHCLFLSKFLLFQEVRRNWTECVETAFEEHEQTFVCRNKDGMLSVVVKTVKPDERMLQEVCKYITKSDSWLKLQSKDLHEIALIRKWNRMFELFGSFRSLSSEDTADEEPILDTRPSSDAGSDASHSYWRDEIKYMNLDTYTEKLNEEFQRCVNGRLRQLELRYRGCHIQTYDQILANQRRS